jgi:hypothetical protein
MHRERQTIVKCLDNQRDHVLGIVDGLSEVQLRTSVLPSGWSCLGMVRHLTFSVERYWFRCIVGGESLEDVPVGAGADWLVEPSEPAEEVFTLYRDEIVRANGIIESTPLDRPPLRRDEWWGEWEVPDLRFILLHVVGETACHAGHLDVVRELLDRRQWMVQ